MPSVECESYSFNLASRDFEMMYRVDGHCKTNSLGFGHENPDFNIVYQQPWCEWAESVLPGRYNSLLVNLRKILTDLSLRYRTQRTQRPIRARCKWPSHIPRD
jgi:hypothetical protein